MEIIVYNTFSKPSEFEKSSIINFLHQHLDEYGDIKKDIRKSVDYSLKEMTSFGGYIVILKNRAEIIGAVVVNHTGMGGYIPENILVYIAIHNEHRGEGLGKKLIKKTIDMANGDIALHVEKDNPAIHLYKKLGFTNPYLEMRLKK